MWNNKDLDSIFQLTVSRQLGKALTAMENHLLMHSQHALLGQLNTLKADYDLLTGYWKQGFDDPQREQLYDQLLRRLYALTAQALLLQRVGASFSLTSLYQQVRQMPDDWSTSEIRARLEAYVTDLAMFELEPEHTRQKKMDAAYQEHQRYLSRLFDFIVSAHQWNGAMAASFTDMLLSPTIDELDQQLLVSAISLSVMNIFDIEKFRVLTTVCQRTSDEALRQRSLVGWVFAVNDTLSPLFPEMQQLVSDLCADETMRQALTELQMQVVFCMAADDDSKRIQNEIMPDLMKGNNMKMTRQGLVEMEEDKLENILHPDAAEENLERMEHSMKKMADMQRQGSDIYFAGFSQMKRFTFFSDLSNWFVPFYHQHPGISAIWNNSRGNKFLKIITRMGAFCDSDKYSFVLAFNQVLSHLPQQMVDMVEKGEASPMAVGGEVSLDEQRKPAFMRRIYLQNLYRFFRLYPTHSEFCNPFDHDTSIFLANPFFRNLPLAQCMVEVAAFLLKQHRPDDARRVLDNVPNEGRDAHYYLLTGHLNASVNDYQQVLQLLAGEPSSPLYERALKGYARSLFAADRYEEALQAYQQLLILHPDHRSTQLNAAICQVNIGDYDEALKTLFRLDFEQAGDLRVQRALAWALTLAGRYDQAVKRYDSMLATEQKDASDLLNYGYCRWFQRDVPGALSLFRQYIALHDDGLQMLEREFTGTEYQLLCQHQISDTEIYLMLDVLQ